MSDVRNVFTTAEVAKILGISSSYLLRIAHTMNFKESEMRATGKRNYLFSVEAVQKLRER